MISRGMGRRFMLVMVLMLGCHSLISVQTQRLRVRHDLGGDFILNGHHGEPVGLKDFRGKIVLLYFGYTTCPDICPATLSHLKLLMQRLETQLDRVQVIFISIDPERDTLERLNDYLPFFHPSFLGLRGSELETMETARLFRVKYFLEYTESSAGYSMAHTDAVFLLDHFGRYRGRYQTRWALEDLVQDVRLLLASAE